MKNVVLISLAVLFMMGLAISSDAAVKKKGMGIRGGMAGCDTDCCMDGSKMEGLKALDLDEKQKEAIQAIHFRTKKDMIKTRAEKEVAEIELKEILAKDPVDLKAAEAVVKKTEGMTSEMKMSHIKAMEEIKSNLNPEQKKKFISMMDMGPMKHGKGIRKNCDMHCMDDMEHGPHDGGTPPEQHKHN
jgi:Spy/CpxP family protein refolding chaperone